MADLPESRQAPHRVHNIVRSLSLRFMDHQGAVKWRGLGLPWHDKIIRFL